MKEQSLKQQNEDRMTEEEGDGVEVEGELAAPDWRVRTGPRNRPTQKEREEHEATHVPFRDWCTRCMMGRRRTPHRVTKQKSADPPRRPTVAMNDDFIKMKPVVNARTMSEEAVTCNAVEEDRHQVALQKGVEVP